MQITIYSTTTCAYCKQLETYLTSKNIPYTTKLIDQDENAQKEMSIASKGYMGVPFSIITQEDGTKLNILGFDRGKLDSIIQ